MKQIYKIAAMCLALGATASPSFAEDTYTLAVLTFENDDYKAGANLLGEDNWGSLVDYPQYGGPLLYGATGGGIENAADNYWWYDENNTFLYSELNYSWGSYCYWNGGIAISNYITTDYTGKSYDEQLEAYTLTGAGGYENSEYFAVCNGYYDGGEYSADQRPVMTFKDGKARVIDHLYLALAAYTINVLANGNDQSPKATADNYVNIIFEGLDAEGNTVGEVIVDVLIQGEPLIGYTMVELADLGEVSSLRMNMDSDIANSWGMSVPAYYILDNIAVRIPDTTSINSISIDTTLNNGDNAIYTIDGRRVNDTSRPGLYIVNGKKVYVK